MSIKAVPSGTAMSLATVLGAHAAVVKVDSVCSLGNLSNLRAGRSAGARAIAGG